MMKLSLFATLAALASAKMCPCPMLFDPWCCDGRQFSNDCTARCQDIEVTDSCIRGECKAETTTTAPRSMAGGYSDYTDLAAVQATVDGISADIFSLLNAETISIEDGAAITVVSAQSQVVAGMNYRVTLNVGSQENVIIQYYVALPYANPDQLPSNIQLLDVGTSANTMSMGAMGAYSDVSDLTTVQTLVDSVDADIKSLISAEGVSVGDADSITVTSAQSQVVAGTNYMVTMNVGLHEDVIVAFFVPLSAVQTPQDLRLVDLGSGGVDNVGSYQAVDDLTTVRSDVQSMDGSIRQLLQNAQILGEGENAAIIVTSAQSQVVAGMNYKVTLAVGMYTDVIISYYVSFSGEATDLQLVDSGSYAASVGGMMSGGYSTVNDAAQLDAIKATVSGMNDDILSAMDVSELCGYEDVSIEVVNAMQQVVAGMNYKVTINVQCVCPMDADMKYEAQNVVISYYVPLSGETTDLQLEDAGDVITMDEGEGDAYEDDDEDAEFVRLFRLARFVGPALLVIVACVCMGMCLRKKNKKKSTGTYEKYEENEAIDQEL